jgi:hypothetical protein
LIWVVGFLAAAFPSIAAEPLTGRWEGAVRIPGEDLTVVVDFSAGNNGAWTGSITMPGLNTKGMPLKDIVLKGSDATFAIKTSAIRGFEATFKGHLDGNGKLTGDFVQGGNTAPFELKQTGPPQVEVPPHSTPIAQELEGEWLGQFQLFGYPRKVTLKLTNNPEHGAAAEFVVVGKRVNNLPVDLVMQDGNLIIVRSSETGITFEGQFQKDKSELRGTFSQGPIEVPFALQRKG